METMGKSVAPTFRELRGIPQFEIPTLLYINIEDGA